MKVKAIVVKTAKLKETKHFFTELLHVPSAEISARHFVMDTGNMRVVFMEQQGEFTIELYMEDNGEGELRKLQDPNGINVIITPSSNKNKN